MTCTAPDATVYDLGARRNSTESARMIARSLLEDDPYFVAMLLASEAPDFPALRREFNDELSDVAARLVRKAPHLAGVAKWVLIDWMLDDVLPNPLAEEFGGQS